MPCGNKAASHITKLTERPRTRGHHATPGAQMLESSLTYLEKIQKEAEEKLKEENEKQNTYKVFKEKQISRKALPPNTFREFQELGETAGIHRSKVDLPHISLEPNHSHFIFADDGSLEFGTDAKLRADVESCVAGIFKGVGVKQTGAGGKILRRIDDGITRMLLKDKQNTGWENAEVPPLPENNTECNTTMNDKVDRCQNEKCGGFFWGAQLAPSAQRWCEFCLRDEAIREKLRGNKSIAFASIPRVNVIALKHSFSHPQPIKIESNQTSHEISKEIERHRNVLESLRSMEYLDSNQLDLYDKAQMERHHKRCIELLELHRSETQCFEVESRDEVLGYFHGSMPELVELIKNVQTDIQKRKNKNPKMLKKGKPKISTNKERPLPHEVPMVCVCVQGGPGTINNVFSAAKNGTACLIVKGSGRAACLISDAVLLKDLSSKARDSRQEALAAFIVKDLGMIMDKSYKKLLSLLHGSAKLLQEFKKELDSKRNLDQLKELDWQAFREQNCQEWTRFKKDNLPLSEALKIEWHASQVVQKYMVKLPFCVTQKLHMVFEAAETGMCKVP